MSGRSRRTLWSVRLVGGEGERTRPFMEQWLGCHLPKQYCSFVGTRSMFQHTWDRADQLNDPERIMEALHQIGKRSSMKYETLTPTQPGPMLEQQFVEVK